MVSKVAFQDVSCYFLKCSGSPTLDSWWYFFFFLSLPNIYSNRYIQYSVYILIGIKNTNHPLERPTAPIPFCLLIFIEKAENFTKS